MPNPKVSAKAVKVLRANSTVVGFSQTLQPKVVKGKPTPKLAIRVYVEKKLATSKIPASQRLPRQIGGVPLDVVAIGKIEPTAVPPLPPPQNRGKFTPLEGGCSGMVTSAPTFAGTLGYFMRDKRVPAIGGPRRPQWYALSCAHVLHSGTVQNETLQPSGGDGGVAPTDWVGKEYLYTFDKIDAALSKIDYGAIARVINLPTPNGPGDVSSGQTVAKSGRTTGVTYGYVDDTGAEFNYQSWDGSPHPVRFKNVILVVNDHEAFSRGGDSGSLVVDPVKQTAIGMVFGGPVVPGPGLRTLVSSIWDILVAFPQQQLVLPGESYP